MAVAAAAIRRGTLPRSRQLGLRPSSRAEAELLADDDRLRPAAPDLRFHGPALGQRCNGSGSTPVWVFIAIGVGILLLGIGGSALYFRRLYARSA